MPRPATTSSPDQDVRGVLLAAKPPGLTDIESIGVFRGLVSGYDEGELVDLPAVANEFVAGCDVPAESLLDHQAFEIAEIPGCAEEDELPPIR